MSQDDDATIERVARAIIDARFAGDEDGSGDMPTTDYDRDLARAAITAYLSALPERELLAEALDALDRIERELSMVIGEKQRVPVPIAIAFESARAAADKIRAALDKGEQQP